MLGDIDNWISGYDKTNFQEIKSDSGNNRYIDRIKNNSLQSVINDFSRLHNKRNKEIIIIIMLMMYY